MPPCVGVASAPAAAAAPSVVRALACGDTPLAQRGAQQSVLGGIAVNIALARALRARATQKTRPSVLADCAHRAVRPRHACGGGSIGALASARALSPHAWPAVLRPTL